MTVLLYYMSGILDILVDLGIKYAVITDVTVYMNPRGLKITA